MVKEWDKNVNPETANIRDFTEKEITQLILDDNFEQNPPSLVRYVEKLIELGIPQSNKLDFKIDVKEIRRKEAAISLFNKLSELQALMKGKHVRIWVKRKKRLKVKTNFLCEHSRSNKIEIIYGANDDTLCK